MEILCLMGLFPEEYENTIIENSISGVQNAANKLQWAIIDGLMQQDHVNVNIINSLFIGSYPKRYKKFIVPSFEFCVNQNRCGYNAGFLNLPLIKTVSRYFSVREKIDQWANDNNGEDKVVIAYAMTSPMVELLHYVKSKYPEVKTILVVPDLPEYMNFSLKSPLYVCLKKQHVKHIRKFIKSIDGYVFLTDYMQEWFDSKVKYTVVEGIYKKTTSKQTEVLSKENVILYSGGLQEEYGVLELVEAFRKLNISDWKLELIGDGGLMPVLREISKQDQKIVLKGLLPNAEVVKRQQQVSILVNPRKGNQEFTKYSFPSKTIEYMSSGTPMAGYRLPGIPEEYFEYIWEIKSEPNGLKDSLEKFIQLSEQCRQELGTKAKLFVETQKNAKKQCNKIIKLIEELE